MGIKYLIFFYYPTHFLDGNVNDILLNIWYMWHMCWKFVSNSIGAKSYCMSPVSLTLLVSNKHLRLNAHISHPWWSPKRPTWWIEAHILLFFNTSQHKKVSIVDQHLHDIWKSEWEVTNKQNGWHEWVPSQLYGSWLLVPSLHQNFIAEGWDKLKKVLPTASKIRRIKRRIRREKKMEILHMKWKNMVKRCIFLI